MCPYMSRHVPDMSLMSRDLRDMSLKGQDNQIDYLPERRIFIDSSIKNAFSFEDEVTSLIGILFCLKE